MPTECTSSPRGDNSSKVCTGMVCLRREGITAKQRLFVYTVVDEKGDADIVSEDKKT
jgi:hypothetical protein